MKWAHSQKREWNEMWCVTRWGSEMDAVMMTKEKSTVKNKSTWWWISQYLHHSLSFILQTCAHFYYCVSLSLSCHTQPTTFRIHSDYVKMILQQWLSFSQHIASNLVNLFLVNIELSNYLLTWCTVEEYDGNIRETSSCKCALTTPIPLYPTYLWGGVYNDEQLICCFTWYS